MRWAGGGWACRLMTYGMVVSLVLLGSSCSPKDEEPGEKPTPSPTASPEPAEAPSDKKLEKLQQENDEIKKALAEILPVLEEVKKLRGENDGLKQAIAEIPALQKALAKLQQENESLRTAAASATATLEMLSNALADATRTNRAGNEIYNKYVSTYQRRAGALLAKYDAAGSVQARVAFLDSLSEPASRQDPAVISVVRRALADPDPSVTRAAIELLEGYETSEILPTLEQALQLADEQTRVAAVEPLYAVNDPQVIRLLAQALNDPSAEVRAAALDAVQEHESDPIKLSIMEQAMASPYADVKRGVASMLEHRSDPFAVDLLLEGLKDQDPAFRAEISESLNFLIDQEFQTYEQANTWWTQNKDKYDADLIRIDGQVERVVPARARKRK